MGKNIFLKGVMLMVGISGLIVLFFYVAGMEHYPKFFPFLPVYYVLNSIPLCLLLNDFSKKKTEAPSLKKLTLLKLVKVIGAITLFVAGLVIDKSTVVPFLVVFVIFYIAYSVFETKLMLLFSAKKA